MQRGCSKRSGLFRVEMIVFTNDFRFSVAIRLSVDEPFPLPGFVAALLTRDIISIPLQGLFLS